MVPLLVAVLLHLLYEAIVAFIFIEKSSYCAYSSWLLPLQGVFGFFRALLLGGDFQSSTALLLVQMNAIFSFSLIFIAMWITEFLMLVYMRAPKIIQLHPNLLSQASR